MRLSDLETGQTAIILKVLGHGAFRKRVMEMGFVRGKSVSVVLDAPLKDPVKYKIMDYEVSLRQSEAAMIEVITQEEAASMIETAPTQGGTVEQDTVEKIITSSKKRINIALVGNPNCGKTSLFNHASGSHEHVGNYSGVTVDAKRGTFSHNGYQFVIYDLPGTYALSAYSPEELYVRHHLVDSAPDVVVNVVAASNLERNLYLTTELIDMDCTMVIALNMYDELEQSGGMLDYKALGKMLGVPIVPTVSRSGQGIDELFDTIINVYENRDTTVRHIHINHGTALEHSMSVIANEIKTRGTIKKHFAPRYLALKMLERDKAIEKLLCNEPDYSKWVELRDREIRSLERFMGDEVEYIDTTIPKREHSPQETRRIQSDHSEYMHKFHLREGRQYGEDVETMVVNEKYGFISGALKETYTPGTKEEAQTTRILDSFVTHKLFGFPIFIFLMWLMFEATFKLGIYPMGWIESGVGMLADFVSNIMAEGALRDLLVDGVIGGVGGVIVFLPNILILYLFISFMEDSGYMARAAFIMDKIMHRIGLHGKSFIPLIMGFGCNVPAIMSSRTIESRSSRIITILINPFMSCSARLPVYILLVGTFFPQHASLVFIGLYILGIVVAVITAKLLRRFMFREDETPFVMELPPYRIPTTRSTLIHMWDKAAQYLRKMGGVILLASIVIWFLSYYPRNETASVEQQQKESYIGRVGQFCEPVVEPLGFNWRISIALLSGTAAKELIVSTLGVLYAEGSTDGSASLSQKLTAPNPESGISDFTPLSALTFMIFVLLYFPCLAALAAIKHESGKWRYAVFSVIYNTAVAWIAAFIVFRIGSLFI